MTIIGMGVIPTAPDLISYRQSKRWVGVRYEFNEQWNVGLVYRFLATDSQEWDVEWWNGPDFRLGVDRVCIHSICLAFSGRF